MKDKFIKLKNTIFSFIKTNKKTTIVVSIAVIIIILAIILMCNKSEVGNTSGNLNNSGFSVKKDGWIYYLGLKNSNSDGIYRVRENTNEKEKISSDYGLYLNASGNYMYYLDRTSGEYNIAKMKFNGEDKQTIIQNVDTEKITVADNWIYYFKDAKFYRARTNGENKQIILEKTVDNYEVVGKWIYYSYSNNGKYIIAKMKTNGEESTKLDNDASDVFFVKNNNIYYIYRNYNEKERKYNYELYVINTNGKDKKKIADISNEIKIDTINFNGNKFLYVKLENETNNLSIYSLDLKGQKETKITDIQEYYTTINVHKNWIYYTDLNENKESEMFRIKENGENKQALSI